ncbi:O-Antigen ligase [compost metagenome]
MVASMNRGSFSLRLSRVAFQILAGVLLLAGLVDLPRQVSVGPISMLGGVLILCTLVPLLWWVATPRLHRPLLAVLAPTLLYIAWSFLSTTWAMPDVTGFQNLLGPVAFSLLAGVAYRYCRTYENGWKRVSKALLLSTGLAVGLYGVNVVIAGFGTSEIIGARTFALFALFGLAVCLTSWRYGWKPGLFFALVIVGTIGASLSRMALAIALLLFLLAMVPLKDWRGGLRLLAMALVISLVAYQLVMRVEPIRERFMEGDTTLEVGGLTINATGRTALWEALLDSYAQSPWIGKGAGQSGSLINSRFSGLGQAHSDYLRILHDLGILGLSLWVLGMLTLLVAHLRGWIQADQRGDPAAAIHLAAALALISVALGMATDNPLVYVFVMSPFGILVGTSLGAMRRNPQ